MAKKPDPVVVFRLTEMAKAVKMAVQNPWWRPAPSISKQVVNPEPPKKS